MIKNKKDLYLKAESEEHLIELLPFARRDEMWMLGNINYSLDILGVIYEKDSGETGQGAKDPVAIEGYHANLRCTKEIADLVPETIIITPPSNPYRKWAGDLMQGVRR